MTWINFAYGVNHSNTLCVTWTETLFAPFLYHNCSVYIRLVTNIQFSVGHGADLQQRTTATVWLWQHNKDNRTHCRPVWLQSVIICTPCLTWHHRKWLPSNDSQAWADPHQHLPLRWPKRQYRPTVQRNGNAARTKRLPRSSSWDSCSRWCPSSVTPGPPIRGTSGCASVRCSSCTVV